MNARVARSLLLAGFVFGAMSCAEEPEVVMLGEEDPCGPNAYLHGGLGVEPHCDCVEGYEKWDDECVFEGSRTPDPQPEPDMGGGSSSQTRALPLACWLPPTSTCDPRSGSGCDTASGETCDVGKTPEGGLGVACIPGPNPQGAGQACDPVSGPFCSHGLHCMDGSCQAFCCDDSECGNGEWCKPIHSNHGNLGACSSSAPPVCAGPGGFCQGNDDCCSGNCHFDHCH